MPERIQLRRTRGSRKPPGAINVARPTHWGNPWRVDDFIVIDLDGNDTAYLTPEAARSVAVNRYRTWLQTAEYPELAWIPIDQVRVMDDRRNRILSSLPKLRGHDLACWCPLTDWYGDQNSCHADVLLELANQEVTI